MTLTLSVYLLIAEVLFVSGIVFGKLSKRDVLGNGVRLGILNSFLLSSLWPVTLIVVICALAYDAIVIWKKL